MKLWPCIGGGVCARTRILIMLGKWGASREDGSRMLWKMADPNSKSHSRVSWPRVALCVAVAAAGLAVFHLYGNSTRGYISSPSLFYWWGFQWVNPRSETQHGFIILAVSLWLAARNARRIPAAEGGDAALAAALAMVAGIGLHVVGFVAEQARVSIVGLLLYAWGVIALAGGPRWARAAAFPVAFMVFAIPLNVLDTVGFWLRMWVVGSSAGIVHAVGVAVLVNGTKLLSPDGSYNYDVAAACSGVRSLMALGALSLLLGYLMLRPWWLRILLFAISFPLVYVGNVARIVAVVLAARAGGQAWGDRAHDVMGYAVFVIVLGGVYAACEAAARLRPQWAVAGPEGSVHVSGADGRPATALRLWASSLCALAATAAAAVFLFHIAHAPPRGGVGIVLAADGRQPAELPTFIGVDWIGKAADVTSVEREVLPADTGFSRKVYVSIADPSKQVFLSIVLSGRDRTSIHRPELCLVGQGWTIRGAQVRSFRFPGSARSFPATVLRVAKEVPAPSGRTSVPQLVAYYFVSADRVVASNWRRMAADAWNRVVHGRADRWAYVLLQTGLSDGEDAALARMQDVLNGTLPSFQEPVPVGG
jgi:EpsI family protein